jgi:hypothetical protein
VPDDPHAAPDVVLEAVAVLGDLRRAGPPRGPCR